MRERNQRKAKFPEIAKFEDDPQSPEIKLLWAILERAILDCIGVTSPAQSRNDRINVTRTAWRFIFDDRACNKSFSFKWICDILDLDAKTIQNRVQKILDCNAEYEKSQKTLKGSMQLLESSGLLKSVA